MAKTRSQLPHLHYPADMQQTRIINAHAFGGGGGGPTFGNASRSFDGVNDFVSFPFPTLTSANTFSVAFWLRPHALSGVQTILERTVDGLVQIYFSGTTLVTLARNDATPMMTYSGVANDVWIHVLLVVSSTTDRKLYINGALEVTDTDTFSYANPAGETFRLGARSAALQRFDGNIADFRIYNAALTSGDASDLESGVDVPANLVLWYFTDTDDVLDHSGNGNHGTNSGSTYSTDGPLD